MILLASLPNLAAAELASEPPSIEQVRSLNGTWRLEPVGGEALEVIVPGSWERIQGLRNVHEATYRREFDIPASFLGQRVFLKFDAVGDAAQVSVNGQYAGGHVGAALPFAVDITDLVTIPSSGNTLAVAVRDDSHFSVARENARRRNRKHWIPHGMGANNRKGLYQNVTLHAVPVIRMADARITTSVRQQQLSVTYEIFNGRKETVSARLAAEVLGPDGTVAFALPLVPVELPGYVTTTVPISAPFARVELWQPDHPALYQLRTTLTGTNGKPIHQLQTRFGFRETWFEGIHFYLNGIRCNLRGESPAYGERTDLLASVHC